MATAVAKDRFDDFEARKATKEAIARELDTLDIVLMAKVNRTAITIDEYIQMRLSQGAAIDVIREDLLTDLAEGGRIFGEFRNALRPTFSGSMNRFRTVGELAELGTRKSFRWIAVLVNTCPDCLARHGRTQTWAEWEEEGLPQAGATVCAEHCNCILIPAEATEMEPVMRGNE